MPETAESINPPRFKRLADLSPNDSELVRDMALSLGDTTVDIDERQAALDTLLEVLDPRPIEAYEWDLDTGKFIKLENPDA